MDISIKRLVKCVTHLKDFHLHCEEMKELCKLCRISNTHTLDAHKYLCHNLSSKLSQVRSTAFSIIEYLFLRSHYFRTLAVENFQIILKCTCDLDGNLPEPLPLFHQMRKRVLLCVYEWVQTYGHFYRKLKLAVPYLERCMKVNFAALLKEEELRRENIKRKEKLKKLQQRRERKKILREINRLESEANLCVMEMDSCFNLLLPTPDNFLDREQFVTYKQHFCEDEGNLPSTSLEDEGNLPSTSLEDEGNLPSTSLEDEGNIPSTSLEDEGNLPSTSLEDETAVAGEKNCDADITSMDGNLKVSLGCPVIDDKSLVQDIPSSSDRIDDGQFDQQDSGSYGRMESRHVGDNSDLTKSIWADLDNAKETLRDHEITSLSDQLSDDVDVDDDYYGDGLLSMRTHGISLEGVSFSLPSLLQEGNIVVAVTEDNYDIIEAMSACKKRTESSLLEKISSVMKNLPTSDSLQDRLSKLSNDLVTRLEKYNRITFSGLDCEHVGIISSSSDDDDGIYVGGGSNTEKSLHEGTSILANENEKVASSSNGDISEIASPFKKADDVDVPDILRTSAGAQLLYEGNEWTENLQVEDKIVVPRPESSHRFWGTSVDEDIILPQDTTRVYRIENRYEPSKWTCRAPLPSGKLCPRMDKLKCPLHGIIIARDRNGQSDESALAIQEGTSQTDRPKKPWQDPVLLRQMEILTGKDLGSEKIQKALDRQKNQSTGRKTRQKKGRSKLLTLTEQSDTVERRLKKKLFRKSR